METWLARACPALMHPVPPSFPPARVLLPLYNIQTGPCEGKWIRDVLLSALSVCPPLHTNSEVSSGPHLSVLLLAGLEQTLASG